MQNTRTRPSTQRRHAAASLEFISRVMARSPETSSTTLSIVVTWTVLTLVAVPITLLLIARQIYGLPIFLTWAVHNAVGWLFTIVATERSESRSRMDRQIIATWATATAAMWAVGAADAWTQAMAHWAIFPMLQLVFGFAVTVNGILVSSPVPVVGGLLLIFTAPLFLAFPVWSSVASGIACAAVILVTTLGLALHLRQVRAAS